VRFGPLPDTNTNFQPAHYGSLDEWQKRREWLRMQVRIAAGLWPEPEKCPLNAHIFGKIDGDGYTIEKVYFESYPGFYCTGNLYRTKRAGSEPEAQATGRPPQGATATNKVPGVLCPHGHWKSGRLEQSELGNIPARCIMLARLGYTVFAYDMAGYNDSARHFKHGDKSLESTANQLWGFGHLHLQTWNSIRALDFLQSLPEVDPDRIGVTGASGGGTQTFILYAVDDRVKVACPVNMISHTMQGGCVCENAPCLRIDTNNMEIGALMAPKPLLMISATGDWTKDTPQVEYPFIRSIYALYNAADKVASVQIDAPHNYNKQSREAMYRFFAKHLLNRSDTDGTTEHDIPEYKAEDLLVWKDENVPKNLLRYEQLAEQLKKRASKVMSPAALTPDDYATLSNNVRTVLKHVYGSMTGDRRIWPMITGSGPRSVDIIMMNMLGQFVRYREVGRHAGQHSKAGSITCILDPLGFDAALLPIAGDDLRQLIAGSDLQQLAVPFSADRSHGLRGEKRSFFTTFNRTDDAETVRDIERLVKLASADHWRIVGRDRLGPLTLVARAMIGRDNARKSDLRTVIDMNRFDVDSDEAYLKELNIPHIRRLGGLRTIAAVACNGPIWFHNVGEHFDEEWVKAAGRVNGVEVRVTKEKADDKQIAEWLTKNR